MDSIDSWVTKIWERTSKWRQSFQFCFCSLFLCHQPSKSKSSQKIAISNHMFRHQEGNLIINHIRGILRLIIKACSRILSTCSRSLAKARPREFWRKCYLRHQKLFVLNQTNPKSPLLMRYASSLKSAEMFQKIYK